METAAQRYARDFTNSEREADRKVKELDGQSTERKSRLYVSDSNVSAVTSGAPQFS